MDWSLEHGMMVRRSGDGPSLLWIHGLGEWSASFDPVASHRALAGFAHVLVDLPGYGRSPWPARAGTSSPDAADARCSIERTADLLAAWLRGRPAPVVVGHSMGGAIATLLGERIALRGIVNVEGNLSHGDCTFSARAHAYSLEDFLTHGFAALQAEAYAAGAEDRALRGYHAALCAASPAVFHRNAIDLVALSVAESLAPRLAALSCPALYIAGVPRGICAHSHGLLDRHALSWLAVEPAGHWVFVDQPTAVADAIASFAKHVGA